MLDPIRIPKTWKIEYNHLTQEEEINKKIKLKKSLFYVTTPQDITLKLEVTDKQNSDEPFSIIIKKDNGFDVYYKKITMPHYAGAYSYLNHLIDYFKSKDWEYYLNLSTKRKYTLLQDRVYHIKEKNPKVLICMDKATRETIFEKNLGRGPIQKIEKDPSGRYLIVLFEYNKPRLWEKPKTNVVAYDKNGEKIWDLEHLQIPCPDGSIWRAYKVKRITVEKDKNLRVSIDKFACKIDYKTGKIISYLQVEK